MFQGKKIAIVIAARMGSTRLPGKCLLELGDRSILEQLILRMQRSTHADNIILATTDREEDTIFDPLTQRLGVEIFHGSVDDVLGRHLAAAPTADIIVRVTGDNPYTDPAWVDRAIEEHLENAAALTTTRDLSPEGKIISFLPKGLSIDVIDRNALAVIDSRDLTPQEREHVIIYFFSHRDEFSLHFMEIEDRYRKDICLTIDTPEDLTLARMIAENLAVPFEEVTIDQLYALLEAHPAWSQINEDIVRKEAS
jgi:spore coat polysaccharide biosynthesis protein SpsF